MPGPGEYENLLQEVTFKATTSGGKGGQHVNKVATRVELYFDIASSSLLSEEQKQKLTAKLRHRISGDGILRITSSEDRSQSANKDKVQRKFLELIEKSLREVKKRKASSPSSSSIAERLRRKKLLSERKNSVLIRIFKKSKRMGKWENGRIGEGGIKKTPSFLFI